MFYYLDPKYMTTKSYIITNTTMAPTMQRKLSASKLNLLCSKGEIVLIIEGAVIKSPPRDKMANESSYKKRWMDLVIDISSKCLTIYGS